MAQQHAQSGQVISVAPLGEGLAQARTTAIFKSEQLEVARIVLLAGKEFPEHRVQGEITIQCIEGQLEFRASGVQQTMGPGDFIHLRRHEPHALRAITDTSLLLTMCLAA